MLALFIGGTLTATSIGVTVRILRDVGRQTSSEGQIVLGAAVIDDLLGVLLLAVLYDFSRSGDLGITNLATLAVFIGTFFVIAPVAAKLISYVVGRVHEASQTPGLIATSIVSLVLRFRLACSRDRCARAARRICSWISTFAALLFAVRNRLSSKCEFC